MIPHRSEGRPWAHRPLGPDPCLFATRRRARFRRPGNERVHGALALCISGHQATGRTLPSGRCFEHRGGLFVVPVGRFVGVPRIRGRNSQALGPRPGTAAALRGAHDQESDRARGSVRSRSRTDPRRRASRPRGLKYRQSARSRTATTLSTATRTSSSPGTPLRSPNSSARPSPMYRAPILVAQCRISWRSSDSLA
jgi:hypothetical protein